MKKQIVLLAVAFSSMMVACNEKEEDGSITEDGVMVVDEATSIDGKTKAGIDSSMSLTDGSRIPVIIDSTNSITLPEELLHVIENTDDLHSDSIVVKRRFEENTITYYELEFRMKEGPNQTITFDGKGKRKSDDK